MIIRGLSDRLQWSSGLVIAVLAVLFAASPIRASAPPAFSDLAVRPFSAAEHPASAKARNTMVEIPAGSYRIGRDNGPEDQRPQHDVTLTKFRIDRTEVTNGAFAEYLSAIELSMRGSFGVAGISEANADARTLTLLAEGREGSDLYPIIALDDGQARIVLEEGVFRAVEDHADHPVTETTWAGALAYCRWRGARLPSEAEWEAAARGSDDRVYPWGNHAPSGDRVVVGAPTGVTFAVGSRPAGASATGLLDMSGSLGEWTSSLKASFPYDAADGREDTTLPGERVTRGGDYHYDRSAETLTVSHRNGFSNAPERGHRHIGFRCAA